MTTLVERLTAEHVENTPRTHDGQGNRIVEAPQCRKCLQVWPCETRQLLNLIEIWIPPEELRAQDSG